MPDYQKGRIYKITGGGLTYVGSTIETLCRRMSGHRSDMKRGSSCSSAKVLCYEDAVITLIELYPCNSVEELKARERYWYDSEDCVNKLKPWVSTEETIERYKAYNETNKEKMKVYRNTNKEQLKSKRAVYSDANRAKILEAKRAYYQANKEQILEVKKAYRETHK